MFGYQFYPTPKPIIERLLEGIELRALANVLEPSAGRGDIVEYIKSKLGDSAKYCNFDCIEIDRDLQSVIKGKGFKVIHDDFLTFSTFKRYNLIVMNPPFSNGERHLLRALELQKDGGQIACILNAETIKNPYSNTRKDLLNQLEKYNAEIEFVQNAFSDADRKTNVEIAIIKVKIENNRENSVIIDHLKQEEKYKAHTQENSQIVSGDYMERIIQQYNFEVQAGVKLISEYEALKPMLSRSFDDKWSILELSIYDDKYSKTQDSLINSFIKKVRYKYWTVLFQSKEFAQLMTTDLRSQYMDKMNELMDYDFSKYNIEQIRLDINNMLKESLQNTIYKLFDDFTRYSYSDEYKHNIYLYNGWKTNSAYKINEQKIILPMSAYDNWDGRFYPTQYTFRDRLRDIYKVFSYLDSGRTIIEDRLDDILKKAQDEGQTKNIDCGYFSITCYKKGSTHFTWTNKELIQKLNIEGCRHKNWLPPSYGKPYKDMTREEQSVIDSFQGKEEYEKIIQDKNFYLGGFSNLLAITG